MLRRLLPLALLALLVALAMPVGQAAEKASPSIQLSHAWARVTPGAGAGYLQIDNSGAAGDKLLAAHAAGADAVELHQHVIDANGVARMRPVDGLVLPAHGGVTFAPGGYHLMFMGLTRTLKDGDRLPVTLTFEKAGEIGVDFVVDNRHVGPAPAR